MGNVFHVNYLHLLSRNEPLKYNSVITTDFFKGLVLVLNTLKCLMMSRLQLSLTWKSSWPTPAVM